MPAIGEGGTPEAILLPLSAVTGRVDAGTHDKISQESEPWQIRETSARGPSPPIREGRLRRGRPKVCLVCSERIAYVDYKNSAFLRRFMSDRGKIKSRANTGTCVQHQHEVAIAIKNAREVALFRMQCERWQPTRAAAGGSGSGPGRTGDRSLRVAHHARQHRGTRAPRSRAGRAGRAKPRAR